MDGSDSGEDIDQPNGFRTCRLRPAVPWPLDDSGICACCPFATGAVSSILARWMILVFADQPLQDIRWGNAPHVCRLCLVFEKLTLNYLQRAHKQTNTLAVYTNTYTHDVLTRMLI